MIEGKEGPTVVFVAGTSKLEELTMLMPFMKQISGQDAEINVWDIDGVVVGNFPMAGVKLPFEIGFQIHDKTDPIFRVMKTGKQEFVSVPAEVFGAGIEGYLTPVMDGNKVVGCVTYVFSVEQSQRITKSSTSLQEAISRTTLQLGSVSEGMSGLSDNINDMYTMSMGINGELDNIKMIIETMQKNTQHLNILALNASIEAARVGAAGRGFTVVASEMAKFSKSSAVATKTISETLTNIVNSLSSICSVIEKSSTIATEQTDEITSITNSFSQVDELSTALVELCSNF